MNIKEKSGLKNFDIILTCFAIAVVILIIQAITGQWLLKDNPYNSYMLQARSWLEGRLDLGKDYPHLELAIFDGKYFVSFPPFPSYLMLPFAMMKLYNADGVIAFISALAAGVYCVKIMHCFGKNGYLAVLWSLFVTIGSNWLFTASVPWVWFIAQNLAFTLSLASIYYALKGKTGISLSLWACAVGCRPFQAIYIVVLLYLLYENYREKGMTIAEMIKKNLHCLIAPCLIAVSYMALNYARFGNILEFGHNYLPEFTRTETGQFNIEYMKNNIPCLFRLPLINDGKLEFQSANGFCIFIASPIFISYIIYFIRSMKDKNETKKLQMFVMFLLFIIHLAVITLHRTMGGSHYGNRYTNDLLPFVFLTLAYLVPEKKTHSLLFISGFVLNVLWSFMYFS